MTSTAPDAVAPSEAVLVPILPLAHACQLYWPSIVSINCVMADQIAGRATETNARADVVGALVVATGRTQRRPSGRQQAAAANIPSMSNSVEVSTTAGGRRQRRTGCP